MVHLLSPLPHSSPSLAKGAFVPWSGAIVLVVLGSLGLLSAYLGNNVGPTLLLGALTFVVLRDIQARWRSREEQQAARAEVEHAVDDGGDADGESSQEVPVEAVHVDQASTL
jgi:hypothetical protein